MDVSSPFVHVMKSDDTLPALDQGPTLMRTCLVEFELFPSSGPVQNPTF
jgi:hypothetical protein